MLTVYKEDLRYELVHRKSELKELLKEREDQIIRRAYNPFKRKSSIELREVIIQCIKEIRKIQKNLKNPLF